MWRTKKTESVFALTLVCFFCIIRRIKNQLINCAVAIYIYKHCDRSWIFPLHIGFNLIVANVFKLFFPLHPDVYWHRSNFLCASYFIFSLIRFFVPQLIILLFVVSWRTSFLSISYSSCCCCAFLATSIAQVQNKIFLLFFFFASDAAAELKQCLPYVLCVIVIELFSAAICTHIAARFKTLSGNCIHNSSHNDRINYWWPTISAYFLLSLFLVYTK